MAKSIDLTFIHDYDFICHMQKVDSMGHQNCSFAFKYSIDNIINYVFSDFDIESRNRVVQQIDVSVLVDSSSQTESCFLTTTEIDASFANFCEVTSI